MFRKNFRLLIFCFLLLIPASAKAILVLPNGYYVMQGVHKANVPDGTIANPKLTGFHLRDGWDWMEPQKGVFNFAYYDAQLAKAARLNKHVTLGLYAGDGSKPAWGNDLNSFTQAIAALGARYGNNPLIDAVHLSAPLVTNNSMEMYPPPSWNGTTAQGASIWETAIDAYNKAFPNKVLILDIAMTPWTRTVDQYARTVLGNRFEAEVDNLKATTNTQARHILELEYLRSQGTRIGFEFVGPSIDQSRFGGSFISALNLGKSLGGSYFQVYQQDVQYLPNPVSTAYTGTGRLYIGGATAPEPSPAFLILLGITGLLSVLRHRS